MEDEHLQLFQFSQLGKAGCVHFQQLESRPGNVLRQVLAVALDPQRLQVVPVAKFRIGAGSISRPLQLGECDPERDLTRKKLLPTKREEKGPRNPDPKFPRTSSTLPFLSPMKGSFRTRTTRSSKNSKKAWKRFRRRSGSRACECPRRSHKGSSSRRDVDLSPSTRSKRGSTAAGNKKCPEA